MEGVNAKKENKDVLGRKECKYNERCNWEVRE